MANRYRGEVACRIGERTTTLRLTLNALAEIEESFGAEGLAGLGQRLGSGGLGARDLRILLGAAVRGGGAALDDAEIGARVSAQDLPVVAEALGRLFARTFGPDEPRP